MLFAQTESNSATADYDKAVQYYYNGAVEKSIATYLRLINTAPDVVGAYLDVIKIYQEQGKVKTAQSIAKQLYNRFPEPEYLRILYIISIQAHDYDTADKWLDTVKKTPETLFYHAYQLYNQRKYRNAVPLLQQVIASSEKLSESYYFLGLNYLGLKDYNNAITALQKALSLEPNLVTALIPLARAYLSTKQTKLAFQTLVKVRSVLPEYPWVNQQIRKIIEDNPSFVEKSKEQKQQKRVHANPPVVQTFAKVAPDKAVMIRVGLSEKLNNFWLKTGGNYRLSIDSQQVQGSAGDILQIQIKDGQIQALNEQGQLIVQGKDKLQFSYDDKKYTTAIFDLLNNNGYYAINTVDRYYRGSFEVLNFPAGLTLVNIVNFEEYLYSVVPSEMPASWPAEALKVQAIAARSYALATMGTYKSRGFDVFSSVASQAYTGVASEDKRAVQAVNDTANMVVQSPNGQVMITYYSANTGGYTDDGNAVWPERAFDIKGAVDLLEKRPNSYMGLYHLDNWVKQAPLTYSSWPQAYNKVAFRSMVWVPAEEMNLRVGRSAKIGNVLGFEVQNRTVSGRMVSVKVFGDKGNTIIERDVIRSRLGGLRNNLVTIETILGDNGKPSYFVLYTAGWGHGVGMDQSGSAGMAADGYKYDKILQHYYPLGKIVTYDLIQANER